MFASTTIDGGGEGSVTATGIGLDQDPALAAGGSGTVIRVSPHASQEAVLYLASGPLQNPDGSWEIVLGLQHADGIIGLDMGLHFNPAAIHPRGVTATGIGAALNAVVSRREVAKGILVPSAESGRQGSGSFFRSDVT
jgi:hypothetical protein